jgi:hypothetical protein
METGQFDRITSSLAQTHGRRGVLCLLAATVFGAGGLSLGRYGETTARSKRKKRKHKKRQPSPAPAPTCSDGIKNGSETGVDCGGPHCPPCTIGQTCAHNTDCLTARCGDSYGSGTSCESCAGDGVCGRDENGGCLCDIDRGVCQSGIRPTRFKDSCDECPPGWGCKALPEIYGCIPPCGSNER